jgi:hypothetical protein
VLHILAVRALAPYYIAICCLSGCTVFFFFKLCHKRHDFREKLLDIIRVFGFSLQSLSEILLILRRVQWDIIIRVCTSSCKAAVIFVRVWWNVISLVNVSGEAKISNIKFVLRKQQLLSHFVHFVEPEDLLQLSQLLAFFSYLQPRAPSRYCPILLRLTPSMTLSSHLRLYFSASAFPSDSLTEILPVLLSYAFRHSHSSAHPSHSFRVMAIMTFIIIQYF